MLELRDVSASYGVVRALRGVSVDIAPGETLAIIGRNGAGKTTTLRVIAGVIQPVAGDVVWKGKSLVGQSPDRRVRQGIVLVPEGRGMFPALSVDDNLRMGAYSKRDGFAKRLEWVYSVVPIIGDRRRQMAGSLSGGEQQLLAVGRGLMADPELLMLDEPSLGLSPLMTRTLYDVLGELKKQNVGMVVVEQYVQFALNLGDKVLGLASGKATLYRSPAELLESGRLAALYMGGGEEEVEHKVEMEIQHAPQR
jgi:branched-chain amino acid transport system ATP-binding protein